MAESILAGVSGRTFFLRQDFCRNTANNINFHYRKLSVKINYPIFLYIQKTLFLALFHNVRNKKRFFPQTLTLPHNFIRASGKSNDPISRRKLGWWQERKSDRFYFIGSFQLPPGVYSKLAFKSQRYRVLCLFNKKLLHYSQHAKNQFN